MATENVSKSGETDLNQVPFAIPLKVKNASNSELSGKFLEFKLSNDEAFLSTLKEPYRIEGKKTMGYEIAEQLNWNLPDHIIYPTGGGTGMGMGGGKNPGFGGN